MNIKNFSKSVRNFGYLKIIALAIVAFNIFLASWQVINGDLLLDTDVARDLLILNEIEQKKFILIGPRSGIGGMYHGPLWAYLNYPVYFLSNADPVAVGWFWILLVVLFLISTFFIVKNLFGPTPAYYYAVLISLFFVTQTKNFIHVHGMIFIAPFLYWSLLKYTSKFDPKFLILSVLLSGLLIQFELAMVSLVVVIFTYILFSLLSNRRNKLYHILLFVFILIPLSTFILFELRHDFFQFKSFQTYLDVRANTRIDITKYAVNRLDFIGNGSIQFTTSRYVDNFFIIILFFALLFLTFQRTKFKQHYSFFIYLFTGYFLVTLFNKNVLLIHHTFPFTPLAYIILASFVTSRLKTTAVLIIVTLIVTNQIGVIEKLLKENTRKQEITNSWINLRRITEAPFNRPDNEFGYFLYSPDKLAYGTKFAMIYQQKRHKDKKTFNFEKKPITYIISAPPPPEDPYVSQKYWREKQINIGVEPKNRIDFPNGYFVERFELSDDEFKKPVSVGEDSGLHFR